MPDPDFASFANLSVTDDEFGVWTVRLNRPGKRNALDLATIEALEELFHRAPGSGARAIVLAGEGAHFCAGLDLVEHHQEDRAPEAFMHVCMRWHEAFNKME